VFVGAVIICLFFLLLVWATKGRGMGWGDVKLGFLIGLVNGFPYGFEAIFFGFVFGAIYSLVLILLKKKTVKDTIAFGPFLILGSVFVLIWGERILNWYTTVGGR
jgi:prepilin signal peptidase PulO-like enzyme (type II secretory pathway)